VKLELFLSLRYFVAKKRRSSISLISMISILSVAIAVMVLIVIFSVLNGFHEDMKKKILSKDYHITLTGNRGNDLEGYNKIIKQLKEIKGITTALPYYQGEGLMKFSQSSRGIKIRGVVPNLLKLDKDFQTGFTMKSGKFDLSGHNNIVVGEVLASLMGITTGDKVNLFVPAGKTSDDFLLPLNIQYRVAGIFSSGFSDFDEFFIFTSLRDAQLLYGKSDIASAIGIKLKNFKLAAHFKKLIAQKTKYNYSCLTWMQLRRNLYQALVTEKAMIGVVMFLLVGIAAFSIASTLIMVVMEKQKEIGILKSMGLSPASIKMVFISQGFFVGLAGTMIGLLLGLLITTSMDTLLTLIENFVNFFNKAYYTVFHDIFNIPYPHKWQLFPQDVYYVSSFPVKINAIEVFIISLGSVLLTTLCALIPAKHAAELKVTEVLHKE